MERFQVQNKGGTIKSCPSRASVVEERPEASGLIRHLLPRPLPPALVVQLLGEPLLPVVCHTTRVGLVWHADTRTKGGRGWVRVPRLRSKRPPWRAPVAGYRPLHSPISSYTWSLFSKSPSFLGKTWMWTCGTVWPAWGPSWMQSVSEYSGFRDREASGKRSCALDSSPWPTTFCLARFHTYYNFLSTARPRPAT